MKKEYDTSVKEAIERVMSVFSEYIKTTPYFDIVWSGKVGYIYISIDSCRGTVGDMDCLVIDSPEELLDKLLYEMAVDIMEEGGHDLNPVEASALERAEVERRLNDVQIGFLRSGHTRMSKTAGNARNGNARK